ncbi:MAG: metallopeptidase family protein [Phycisphaerae bacterium]|nr:metallopeptidase family protein [Phycisphaerae bacterium]
MTKRERERFDTIFEDVLESLPESIHALLDDAPVVLEDRAPRKVLEELGIEPEDDDLCGLHTGVPLTQRSVNDHGVLPDVIHLFREGIVAHAGGWEEGEDEEGPYGGEERIREEIRITLLHEIGHHFGLDEDDLERLGYA